MTQRGHLVEACLLEEAKEYLVQAQYARVRVTKQAIALRCRELVVRSVAGTTAWSSASAGTWTLTRWGPRQLTNTSPKSLPRKLRTSAANLPSCPLRIDY